MFYQCESLISLPDISKWNIDKINNMGYIFSGCLSLLYIIEKSKDNKLNRKNSYYMLDDNIKINSSLEYTTIINEKNEIFNKQIDDDYIEMFESYMHGDKNNTDEDDDYSDLLDY